MKKAIAASIFASFALGALAENYTWQGTGENASWSEESNWSPNGVPGAGDTAIFGSAATVSFGAETSVSKITANAEVEFRSANNQHAWYNIKSTTWDGSGTITLVCVGISNLSGNTTISANIKIPSNKKSNGEEQDVWIEPNGGNINISGNISGDGLLKLSWKTNSSIFLSGDNSSFTGTARTENNGNCHVRFSSPSAGFPNGTFYNQQDNNTNTVSGDWTTGGTIKFGSWIDKFTRDTGAYFWRFGKTQAYIEIGALNSENDYIGHSIAENKNSNMNVGLRKVGAGTLTIGANLSHGKETFIDNGTLVLNVANALDISSAITFGEDSEDYPLASFPGGTLKYKEGLMTENVALTLGSTVKNSKGAVVIDTNGNDVNCANALTGNTGGIIKQGEGKLSFTAFQTLPTPVTVSGGELYAAINQHVSSTTFVLPEENSVLSLYGSSRELTNTKVTGKGTLRLVGENGKTRSFRIMNNDFSEFTGTLEFAGVNALSAADGFISAAGNQNLTSTTLLVSGEPETATRLLDFEKSETFGALQVTGEHANIRMSGAHTITFGSKSGSSSILNGQFIASSATLTKEGDSSLTIGSSFDMVSGSTVNVQGGKLVVNADLTGSLNYTLNISSGVTLAGSGTVTEGQFNAAASGGKITYSVKVADNKPLTVNGAVDLGSLNLELDMTGFNSEATGTTYTLLKASSLTGTPDQSLLSAVNEDLDKGKWKLAKSEGDLVLKFVENGFIIILADNSNVFLDDDADLNTWIDGSTLGETQTLDAKNLNGISPIAAYLLGYSTYDKDTTTPPVMTASVSGDSFTLAYDLSGKTSPAPTVSGITLNYAIEYSSNPNFVPSETVDGTTLAFESAGLYNRLVANIVAAN